MEIESQTQLQIAEIDLHKQLRITDAPEEVRTLSGCSFYYGAHTSVQGLEFILNLEGPDDAQRLSMVRKHLDTILSETSAVLGIDTTVAPASNTGVPNDG